MKIVLKTTLTAAIFAIYVYILHVLEYWSQLSAIDNIAGAAPLILLTGTVAFLAALIWKRKKAAKTSIMVLTILCVFWAMLLIPSFTGNWYPLAQTSTPERSDDRLPAYAPFKENTLAARLPVEATLSLNENLPDLDGATALYPVYSASDGSYPFSANFYAVTNGEPASNVRLFIDWILSDQGQYLIAQTEYAPLKSGS